MDGGTDREAEEGKEEGRKGRIFRGREVCGGEGGREGSQHVRTVSKVIFVALLPVRHLPPSPPPPPPPSPHDSMTISCGTPAAILGSGNAASQTKMRRLEGSQSIMRCFLTLIITQML